MVGAAVVVAVVSVREWSAGLLISAIQVTGRRLVDDDRALERPATT
jgi:hypothetical protein